MKIIMTGKSGLIGSAIYKKLVQNGNSILTIGRRESDYKIDLNRFKPIDNLRSCDIFLHCAGVTDEEILKDKREAILRGTSETANLMDWVSLLKPLKIVYISTAHVYGDLNRTIDEDSTINPISLYAILHHFCEQYIKIIGIPYLIMRPLAGFGEVGKNFNRWELIPFSFPRSLAIENKIVIKTHGKQFRNFVSTRTIAKIVNKEIQVKGSKVINPIGLHDMSIIDFANYCIKVLSPNFNKRPKIIKKQEIEYKNRFNYSSKYKYGDECPFLLKNHIKNIYKKFTNNEEC